MDKKRNKQAIQLLSIFSVTGMSVLLLFFPDVLGNDISYKSMYDTKKSVEKINDETSSLELDIEKKIKELDSAKEDRDQAYKNKESIDYNREDFDLDIPSFLISLEQKALESNIKLEIGYDYARRSQEYSKISAESNDGPTSEENLSEVVESNPVGTEESSESSSNPDSIFGKVNKEGNESFEEIMQRAEEKSDFLGIEGINVEIFPVKIEGSSYYVREYIRELDEIGMIEPSLVRLHSLGKDVRGSVVLNIFHGSVE